MNVIHVGRNKGFYIKYIITQIILHSPYSCDARTLSSSFTETKMEYFFFKVQETLYVVKIHTYNIRTYFWMHIITAVRLKISYVTQS